MLGHLEIVTYLLDVGAPIGHRDDRGRDALLWASQEGHVAVVNLLIERGANVIESRSNEGFTVLMAACQEGYTDIVRTLLLSATQIYDRFTKQYG